MAARHQEKPLMHTDPSLCGCGCGKPAPIATRTDTRRGAVKGKPRRFIQGHSGNKGRKSDLTGAYKVNARTGCWEWQRHIHHSGYAAIGRAYGGGQAHRFIYELFCGPISEGLHLDHRCRNRSCVNPDHLEPVTNAENCRRGANAKLTVEDVRELRRLRADGMLLRHLSARFGISEGAASSIARGKSWGDV